ncbi:serine/threonine-protein kinase [Piscinibacter sakaiensis]|uniref:serine/threonine-protein kinase n=1 Tax=Piscinibacter sakaiensis TaxID=1547922 RepID=UPI0037290178
MLQQPPPHPPPEDGAGLVGLRIGAWRLEAPIGQGGSGSVWRARRCDGRVEGVAAVKLLHLSWLGHGAAERFRREGAILARLTHPHIARLLDAGVSDGGQPYLVLELVDGEPIDRRCDRLRMDVDARLRCFLDVLGAVAHAHRHLVVHRDIKPANVMLGDDGLVKLLDFGIAKLLEDEGEGSTALTRAAGTVLTPDYAAPEQIAGGPISTATDIYALGVLLYQLLGGTHPTGGATALDTIVARMLRKRPAERYASVDAVAEDLRRHLAHLPVEARPDTWRYRAGKFVRRHRVPVAAAALGELARVERDRALRELDQARAANEFIGDVLTEGSRRPNPTSGAQLDRAARLLAQQFDETPALKLRLGLMLGTMYGELRENAKARAVLDEAAELGRRRPEATDPGDRAEVDCLRHALAGDLARLEAVIAALPEHPAPEAGERGSSDATDQRATRAVCLTGCARPRRMHARRSACSASPSRAASWPPSTRAASWPARSATRATTPAPRPTGGPCCRNWTVTGAASRSMPRGPGTTSRRGWPMRARSSSPWRPSSARSRSGPSCRARPRSTRSCGATCRSAWSGWTATRRRPPHRPARSPASAPTAASRCAMRCC